MKNTLILLIVFLSNSLFSQNKSLQENFIDIAESKCFGKQDISARMHYNSERILG